MTESEDLRSLVQTMLGEREKIDASLKLGNCEYLPINCIQNGISIAVIVIQLLVIPASNRTNDCTQRDV